MLTAYEKTLIPWADPEHVDGMEVAVAHDLVAWAYEYMLRKLAGWEFVD